VHARALCVDAPFRREYRPLLLTLDAESRLRAARCAVLLADVGFGDASRWVRAIDGTMPPCDYAPGFFVADAAVEVMRMILTCAAHLVHSDPVAARLMLGMSPACIEAFEACTVTRMARLAESHWQWLRPRWQHRSRYWRELLFVASGGSVADQTRIHARGLQLLAGETRLVS
jgi:hypothetical protein